MFWACHRRSWNLKTIVFQDACPNLSCTCPGQLGKCLCSTWLDQSSEWPFKDSTLLIWSLKSRVFRRNVGRRYASGIDISLQGPGQGTTPCCVHLRGPPLPPSCCAPWTPACPSSVAEAPEPRGRMRPTTPTACRGPSPWPCSLLASDWPERAGFGMWMPPKPPPKAGCVRWPGSPRWHLTACYREMVGRSFEPPVGPWCQRTCPCWQKPSWSSSVLFCGYLSSQSGRRRVQ